MVVDLAVELTEAGILAFDIKVMTPYRSQRFLIRNLLWRQSKVDAKGVLVKSTFESQGTEAKIVILSLVVNNPDNQLHLGSITDEKRLNLSITRAQRFLFAFENFKSWYRNIVGCRETNHETKHNTFLTSRSVHRFQSFFTDCMKKKYAISSGNWISVMDHFETVAISSFYQGRTSLRPEPHRTEDLED